MKNLQLIPDVHKQHAVVKVSFAYDKALIALVKSQKGARWSQTLHSWYFQKKDFQLNTFYQALSGKVYVDYSKLRSSSLSSFDKKTIHKKTILEIQLLQKYKEHLVLKRYSQNTIKTYCSCFLKFMIHFKGQSIDALLKEKIQAFLLRLIQQEKVSPSTQNQYINAIKFYYEKVLDRPKMVFQIECWNG